MAVETERAWVAGAEIQAEAPPARRRSLHRVWTQAVSVPGRVRAKALSILRGIRTWAVSSLTRRIAILNFMALLVLLVGMFYLDHSRAGLIEAQIDTLLTQGEVMSSAVAASAIVGAATTEIDAEKLFKKDAGRSATDDGLPPFEFPINPVQVAPMIQRVISPARTRVRVYDFDGLLVLDSRSLYARGQMQSFDLTKVEEALSWWRELWAQVKLLQVRLWLRRFDLPRYEEPAIAAIGSSGHAYPEIATALAGAPSNVLRANEHGQLILSVAVPIERSRRIFGVLLLTSEPGVLDATLDADGLYTMRLFAITAMVTVALSILFAGTIAEPVRRLAEAAERVRHDHRSHEAVPIFTRKDEIGHLARALRDMTEALHLRIDAIERFAADVSHELKNPLTSLRSAVETLPKAQESDRERLFFVVQNDVRRLDRLISDISNASRLDAELARGRAEPVDVVEVLRAIVAVARERLTRRREPRLDLVVAEKPPGASWMVRGYGDRLGQVITNLVDNAKSFSPRDGSVRILVRVLNWEIEIAVEDDGPGIPPDNLERIFERFYTDRPENDGFGQNSGLGLSISKQIIEAHGGRIWAENRLGAASEPNGERRVMGARFVVRLPRLEAERG